MEPAIDTRILRQQAYATDEHLNVRYQIHEQYSVPRVDFPDWVLSRVTWRGEETLLDVGCGPGSYAAALAQSLPGVRYYGVDFSSGILAKHPARRAVVQADARDLPFADQTFDVVMANHVLYHLPDIDHAIKEIRRVLKPDGILVAATNSVENTPQFHDLYKRAIMVLTAPGKQVIVPRPASHAFSLESGTRYLARNFFAVVRYDLPGTFVFDEVEPVLAYLESARSLSEPQLPLGVSWDAVMMIVREQIRNQLNYVGELVVHKLSGVLIASDQGGFIHDYVDESRKLA
ncbi:MAG: class I SAM-dependent methyltransferase [Anaerolineae bacterium]|jgi:SAM-dependent methyltransferase|nr:class I SAM-dependent methyltransferase [Anaerolineae bacterium]